MDYKVIWTPEAEEDLYCILAYYLDKANLKVADDIHERIRNQIATLKKFPHRCRPGQVSGTKEYIISRLPYMAVVEIVDNEVYIYGVVHTSRKYPLENNK